MYETPYQEFTYTQLIFFSKQFKEVGLLYFSFFLRRHIQAEKNFPQVFLDGPSSGLLGLSMCRQAGGCLWPPPQPTCILPILKAAFPSLPSAKVSEYFRLVEFTWQLGTWELTSFSFRCHRNVLFLLSLIKSLIMITIFL